MNELPREKSDESIQVWLPTFVALTGMGLLTLTTPFFTELTDQQWKIDLVVGGLMTLSGAIGSIICQRKLRNAQLKLCDDGRGQIRGETFDTKSIEIARIDGS